MANTTLQTVADYITDARVLILDKTAPFRYDDPTLLVALNLALLEGARVRADLFVYTGDGTVPNYTAVDTTPVVMDAQFRMAFLYGLCAHALLRDEEDVQDARANSFNTAFHDLLLGVKPSPVQGGTPAGPQPGARK